MCFSLRCEDSENFLDASDVEKGAILLKKDDKFRINRHLSRTLLPLTKNILVQKDHILLYFTQ